MGRALSDKTFVQSALDAPDRGAQPSVRRSESRGDRSDRLLRERTRQVEQLTDRLRQVERLSAMGSMAAGLGHDMSNIALAIRLQLDAVCAGDLPEDVRCELESMASWIDHLAQLGSGLRLLAADPTRQRPAPEGTALPKWWTRAEPLLRRSIPAEVALEADLDDVRPVAVSPAGLSQAVLNLVVNAGQALDGARGRIVVSAVEDGSDVVLSVRDDGPGMDAPTLARATDPFFTTKRRGSSTGLGLSLVRGVVEHAGGRMRIDSTPGAGTCIDLTFPIATPSEKDVPRLAYVSISDPRMRAYARALLIAFGFAPTDGLPSEADGALWVTVDGEEELAACERLGGRTAPVVIGPASPKWAELGATIVSEADGLGGLRDAISRESTVRPDPRST